MFRINKYYNYYRIICLCFGQASITFTREMNRLKEHMILQLLCIISVIQLFSYQVDDTNSNKENVFSNFGYIKSEYVIERDVEKHLPIDNQTSKNSDDNTRKDNALELEEEIDDCRQPEFYSHYIFGYACTKTYSIEYKEEYTLQFRPEIIPPPPKA